MAEEDDTVVEKPRYRRVKTPTLIQMEAAECGAVALGIILAYYGKYISIEDLRIICGVSRDGSNAFNIVEAATTYGMKARGFSEDLDELFDVELPAILYWKFEHFVVLEGFGKKCVYINDPATGPRSITYEDLDQSFTGVVIVFTPTASFVKSGKPPSLVEALYKRLKSVSSPLLYAVLVGICLVIPTLALPAFTSVFIDQVIVEGMLSWKWELLIGIFLAAVISGLLTWLQGNILNRLHAHLAIRFASDALWHMLRLPISFYTQRYPGEIAYRLVLNDAVSQAITSNLATTTINVLFTFVYGLAMLYYDVTIALTTMAVISINFVILQFVFRARSDAYACYQADLGKSMSYSIGALSNMETIKATGTEIKFFSKWASYYTKVVNVLQNVGKKDMVIAILSPFLQAIAQVALIAVGGWRMLHGDLTIGMFVALQILMNSFIAPVMQLVGFSQTIQLLKVDISRLDDIMKNPVDRAFKEENKTFDEEILYTKLDGYVELDNVTFGYSPLSDPIIKKIHLSLNPGKSVALVGPTGCGKSSIAKLITGIHYPWSGKILFDGIARELVPRQKMVSSLAIIEQEPFMFNGTATDNLTLLDTTIPQEDIITATKDACIHDDILARPGGYDMEIEENGSNLSGGQRQRFEIARALVKNPTILIMDEATSALDSETEAEIIKNIRRRGCTLLMIAHRLSTIRNCDEILVMDKGEIVAAGTHEELKATPGLYRELILSELEEAAT